MYVTALSCYTKSRLRPYKGLYVILILFYYVMHVSPGVLGTYPPQEDLGPFGSLKILWLLALLRHMSNLTRHAFSLNSAS